MTALSDRIVPPTGRRADPVRDVRRRQRSASTTSARARAAWRRGPTRRPPSTCPTQLRELDYDAYRDIRFRPEKALWRAEKLPFELMFFHQGRTFPSRCGSTSSSRPASAPSPSIRRCSTTARTSSSRRPCSGLGFNGFRVHYPINKPGYKDEVARVPGRELLPRRRQGPVVRAVGARPGGRHRRRRQGEEFPRFVEFWIERPRASATSLTIYALLDSRRVAGAYRFVLTPGVETTMQVTARLYLRESDRQARRRAADEHVRLRREPAGPRRLPARGARLRRPVDPDRRRRVDLAPARQPAPPARHLVRDDQPARLRPDAARPLAASYEDPEALYERRPSAWIEPIGNWGAGRVELVQIPTPDETNDNIVAFWVPQAAAGARASRSTSPTSSTGRARARCPPARAGSCRRGAAAASPRRPTASIQYVVDFDGPALRSLAAATDVEPVIWVDANAEVRERNLFKNPVTGAWRMTVRFKRNDAAKPVELRAYLKQQQSNPDRDMELHPSRRGRQAVTPPLPHPPLARALDAGRALGRLAVAPAAAPPARPRCLAPPKRRASDARPLMARRLVLLVLVLLGACVGTPGDGRGAAATRRGARRARPARPVRHPLRVDLGRLLDRRDGRRRAPLRPRREPADARPRERAAAPARPRRAHGDRHADLQRARADASSAACAATIDSLVATGESEHFDVYVLQRHAPIPTSAPPSTRRGASSPAASRPTRRREPGAAVHYRWRQRRIKRKAGNVADFCRRWGADYRYLVVLDADSVMTGECLTTLVRLMEAHPDAGIIQTAPRAVGHDTLHAPRPAVRGARLRAAVHRRHALLAARRIALLGPQRDPAHGAVHGALRAGAAAGPRRRSRARSCRTTSSRRR